MQCLRGFDPNVEVEGERRSALSFPFIWVYSHAMIGILEGWNHLPRCPNGMPGSRRMCLEVEFEPTCVVARC